MEPQFVMPLPLMAFFFMVLAAIVYAIKAVIDARLRTKLITSSAPVEIVNALFADEQRQRRHSSLRWGVVLSFIAGGFVIVESLGWKDAGPGPLGILLGATGVGNLAYYLLDRLLAGSDRPR